ncbi:MAG: glycosyltransferase family 87 protein, partial [Acetobacteraceae bacterium]
MLAALVGLYYAQRLHMTWAGTTPRNDFFALWSWSAMIHAVAHPLDLYDAAKVNAFLHVLDLTFHGHYPFAYPPSFLLLIWPLALMGRWVAYGVWVLVTLALYLAAIAQRPWRRPIMLLVLLAPATALTAAAGQNGLLTAALLIGGCRLIRARRPVLAGVLFGLLSCKPQLGVLVPVALLAAGQWRTIAAAAATVLATILASAAAFGWMMWVQWGHALFGLSHFVGDNARLFHLMPTITDNLHLLGAGPSLRISGQAAGALIAIVCVWLAWRRGTGRLPAAVLLAGTFLATPYAFYYDLPILTCALLDFVLERVEARGVFTALELLAVLAAVLLPIPMLVATRT